MNKPEILVRKHDCWCDSCFCGCEHEAYDLINRKYTKITGRSILGYNIKWSRAKPTCANYMLEKGEIIEQWDAEKEVKERNL